MKFDIEQEESEMSSRGWSSTLYSREGAQEARLEDFKFKYIIGQGSFGKVFLAENKHTGELYAMKAIRKDKIIDYEQLESTKLEKFIQYENEHPFIVKMYYLF